MWETLWSKYAWQFSCPLVGVQVCDRWRVQVESNSRLLCRCANSAGGKVGSLTSATCLTDRGGGWCVGRVRLRWQAWGTAGGGKCQPKPTYVYCQGEGASTEVYCQGEGGVTAPPAASRTRLGPIAGRAEPSEPVGRGAFWNSLDRGCGGFLGQGYGGWHAPGAGLSGFRHCVARKETSRVRERGKGPG